jgi:hypothetical protein
MARIILFLILITINFLVSKTSTPITLKQTCLECHQKQQMPSELIYRKYLAQYSSIKIIRKKMFNYLKNPKKENSIMPKQFFLKFPMKKRIDLNDTLLSKRIKEYIDFYDVRKKLILPKN